MTKSELTAAAEALEWACSLTIGPIQNESWPALTRYFQVLRTRATELRAQAAASEAPEALPIVDGSKPYYVETDGVRRKYLPGAVEAVEAPEPVAWRITQSPGYGYSYTAVNLAPLYPSEPLYLAPVGQSARIAEYRAALQDAVVTLQHTKIFTQSREKMHTTGQELYDQVIERIRAALGEKP